jgi:hypothetical protein
MTLRTKIFTLTLVIFALPFFVFAQEATTVEDDSDMRTFQEKKEDIVDALPDPVVEKTVSVTNRIEAFRMQQSEGFAQLIDSTKVRIEELGTKEAVEEAITNEEPTPAIAKPLQYIKLAFFHVMHFLFRIKAVFYVVGVLLVVSILRGLIRNIRSRSMYD